MSVPTPSLLFGPASEVVEPASESSGPSSCPDPLDTLLRHPKLWRPGDQGPGSPGWSTEATGHPVLDESLPGRGWPYGALTEIIVAQQGIGELALVLPALARLAARGRAVVWVAPPYVPYAPALEQQGLALPGLIWLRAQPGVGLGEHLWAAEQALRSGICGAVLIWMPETPVKGRVRVNARVLRRLQLAAEQGDALGFVFWRRAPESSPAALKIRVSALRSSAAQEQPGKQLSRAVLLEILKCRGLGESEPIKVEIGNIVC